MYIVTEKVGDRIAVNVKIQPFVKMLPMPLLQNVGLVGTLDKCIYNSQDPR